MLQRRAHSLLLSGRGFTLIELVVGITLVAIAVALLANLVVPAVRQSAEPLAQQRAASLAQALMDEILSKRYDELTPEGGIPPCSPCSATLGPETGETRATFDDVDDYNSYCPGSAVPGSAVIDANDVAIANYGSYSMSICVNYDTSFTGDGVARSAKRITVTITPSKSVPMVFTAYRTNF